MKHVAKYLLLLSFCSSGHIAMIGQSTLSPRIANYDMDITLDVVNKKLQGKTILVWKNVSDQPTDELYFHLYYNAFRNSNSTFFKERGVPAFLTNNIDENCGWGWSEIIHIEDQDGQNLTSNITYVAPDDGNEDDRSVLNVQLETPVGAGESHTFIFDWEAKIPQTMPRTGYNMDYYFFAQWFPKLGVLEPAGMRFSDKPTWNCHQYHSSGEYYSDFGLYNVNLTVPSDYVVAASGELIGQSKTGSTKTWSYRALDVIDFTWTTSPHYEVQETSYKDVGIALYSYPEKAHFSQRYFDAITFCMQYLDEHLGTYPYNTLSIIDPPIHGMYTGGMEYPTLITSLTFNSFPSGFKTAETLVTHEFIHQYFMQMVATHEVEEPWMDEGITTYYENRILDAMMGERESFIDFIGVKIGSKAYNRGEFFASGMMQMGNNTYKSYEFTQGGYKEMSYNKTAIWLQTLEGIIGAGVMDEIMRSYFQRWKFKHPCRHDFIDVVNEIIAEKLSSEYPDGMDWFFDQVLYGTDICDYRLASIRVKETEGNRGYISSLDDCVYDDVDNETINTEIVIHRVGGLQLPVDIRVNFDDGSYKDFQWNGKEPSHAITVQSEAKVTSAQIDSERKLYLDQNFINNSLVVNQERSGMKKFMAGMIDKLMHSFELMTMII